MKILFISGSPPYPSDIGGNQLAEQMLRALARQGEVELFLALNEDDLPAKHLEKIRTEWRLVGTAGLVPRSMLGCWRWLRLLFPGIVDRVADLLASRRRDYVTDFHLAEILRHVMEKGAYDVVVSGGLALAMKSGIPPDFPVVVNVNDVELEWYESQVSSPVISLLARALAWWRLRQLKTFVPSLYRRYRHCWVIKKKDRYFQGLEHANWLGMPCRIPNEELFSPEPSEPRSRVILMLGSYYHRPNAEGLEWFLRRVWPQINTQVPDAEFRVVGPGLKAAKAMAYARIPGVKVLGPVPSVLPQYKECAFTIAPIWTGAGINIKVFESYVYRRACVLTPFAYRGYEDCLEPGKSVLVAERVDDYARCCTLLLNDHCRRDQLAANGYPQIVRNFSFERFARVVDHTLENIEKA